MAKPIHVYSKPALDGLSLVEDRSKNGPAGDRTSALWPIGDHGITILLARGELDLESDLRSDIVLSAPS